MLSSEKLPVSVVVLTYNEERNIGDCLRTVQDWAGEIFVVDSGSTDRTLEIASRQSANVVSHPFENYSRQRNWAQQNLPLAHEWVFHIDADERVSPELAASLRAWFAGEDHRQLDGAVVTRRTVFMGRPIWHGGCYPNYHLRLFRWRKGRCEDRQDNQHFRVDGPTRIVPGDLVDVAMSSVNMWMVRHARWGAAEAREMMAKNGSAADQVPARVLGGPIERKRWLRNSLYGRAPLFLRAFGYFLYRYVLRLGFLDGREGLIFHFLHGCCYRFYVDAIIYEASREQPAGGARAELSDRPATASPAVRA
jgi:glycosyltransferase involved in cell wall biosynthesis